MEKSRSMLQFGTKMVEPSVRTLFDMKDVIYDREWLGMADNIELYYMYRELSLNKNDALAMKEHNLRYDITVIPPHMLGCEFVKTAGHYHPKVAGYDMTFPEIYEVLSGEAQYLLQKHEDNQIKDIIIIKASVGDRVVVPPGYGHLTINASNKVLKMANWVECGFESIYLPIKEKGGGAYFVLDKGFVKNPRYDSVPEIRLLKPPDLKELGLQKSCEMYELIRDTKMLEFLTKPQEYGWLFEKILSE